MHKKIVITFLMLFLLPVERIQSGIRCSRPLDLVALEKKRVFFFVMKLERAREKIAFLIWVTDLPQNDEYWIKYVLNVGSIVFSFQPGSDNQGRYFEFPEGCDRDWVREIIGLHKTPAGAAQLLRERPSKVTMHEQMNGWISNLARALPNDAERGPVFRQVVTEVNRELKWKIPLPELIEVDDMHDDAPTSPLLRS